MGKLVSIVTTCLVVLNNKFYFWKNRLWRRTKRRFVMGTADRRRDDGLSQVAQIPGKVRFLVKFQETFLDYSFLNYRFRGVILITKILEG